MLFGMTGKELGARSQELTGDVHTETKAQAQARNDLRRSLSVVSGACACALCVDATVQTKINIMIQTLDEFA